MGQPVKLSDKLVLAARRVAPLSERSIAGQIEFWSSLGQAIEPLLDASRAWALRQSEETRPLSECLATVNTEEGRKRVRDYLASTPFPHYEAAPNQPGMLVRIDADGTRTVGKFVDRDFIPVA